MQQRRKLHGTQDPDLVGALAGRLRPTPPAAGYKAALLFAALAMVVLPLVYLAMIAGVVLATLHFVLPLLDEGREFVAIVLGVVGLTVVFFLGKPLFAPRARPPKPHSLDPQTEPLLFAFVERLCGLVGAPAPRRIDVDLDANASASLRRGLRSIAGRDLVLTIGLPLPATLTLREFTGVLAHEFGHFGQGAGMGLTYVVRSVNAWFARVVYERDAWDERLVAAGRVGDVRVLAIVWTARAFIAAGRGVLWVLMHVGHGVSCWAMRQMEYDADSYEARVGGVDAFETTTRKLPAIAIAVQLAWRDVESEFGHGRLCDDFVGLAAARFDRLTAEEREAILGPALEARTKWHDTHPAAADRIRAARRLGSDGVFRVRGPATALFADFDALAREATKRHYRHVVGARALKAARFVPVDAVLGVLDADDDAADALGHYFGEVLRVFAPVFPHPDRDARADPGATADETARAKAAEALDALEQERLEAEQQDELRRSGRVRTAKPPPHEKRRAQVRDALVAAHAPGLARLERDLRAHDDEDGRLARLLGALRAFEQAWPHFDELFTLAARIAASVENFDPDTAKDRHRERLLLQVGRERELLVTLRRAFKEVPYPFEHADPDATVASQLIRVPPRSDHGAILETGSRTLDELRALYFRSLAHTCRLARAAAGDGATREGG